MENFSTQTSPPTSPKGDDIILEGYLLKQASRLSQKYWHDRYFVLRADNTLSYFRRKDDTDKCRGTVQISNVTGCEVSDLFVEKHNRQLVYCFRITSSDEVITDDRSVSHSHDGDSFVEEQLHNSSHMDELSVSVPGSPLETKKSKKASITRTPLAKLRKRVQKPSSASDHRSPSGGSRNIVASQSLDGGGGSSIDVSWRLRRRRKNGKSKEAIENGAVADGQSVTGVPNLVEVERQLQLQPLHTENSGVEDNDNCSTTPVMTNQHNHHRPPKTSNVIDAEQMEEQEYLRSMYLTNRKENKLKTKRMLVQGTKLTAVAGATVGITIATAGLGLVAGLVALGVAGAAGGGGAAVNWYSWQERRRNNKGANEIVVACEDYETARQWKSSLDAALESDNVQTSTWGHLFASDKQKARAAVVPVDRRMLLRRELSHSSVGAGGGNVFFGYKTRWIPLEGGLLSIIGCGYQSLRILREERYDEGSDKGQERTISHLSVDGKPCVPMKSHSVMSTSPLNAFLCLMSYGRVQSLNGSSFLPENEHRISFQVIESIDEHTDVIHLVMRPLYLFPSWTTSRDFCLYRYWRLEQDGSYIVCYESFEHDNCPPSPDHVRGEMHQVFNIAPLKKNLRRRAAKQNLPSNECLVTATVQVDPKGWVPTTPFPVISHQAYGDAFGITALLQLVDIRDAIDHDRFVPVVDMSEPYQQSSISVDDFQKYSVSESDSPSIVGPNLSTDTGDETLNEDVMNYDFAYVSNESTRLSSQKVTDFTGFLSNPPQLTTEMWAEPDSNSFRVRGSFYLSDKKKYNAGPSLGRLIATDVVSVDEPLFSGFSEHPTERIQLALQKEAKLLAKGLKSDLPPFIFVVNIALPGPPFFHGVFYYGIDDISSIDGTNGSPSSKLCKEFFFGDSDEFRDKTFKLIPQIVQGNFVVRKSVGSTPAIIGKKLRQLYVKSDRYFEVILDCGSSSVATGVIRVSLGYAKTLVVDMAFLLEGDEEEYLPERLLGCCRMKNPEFGPQLRRVVALK